MQQSSQGEAPCQFSFNVVSCRFLGNQKSKQASNSTGADLESIFAPEVLHLSMWMQHAIDRNLHTMHFVHVEHRGNTAAWPHLLILNGPCPKTQVLNISLSYDVQTCKSMAWAFVLHSESDSSMKGCHRHLTDSSTAKHLCRPALSSLMSTTPLHRTAFRPLSVRFVMPLLHVGMTLMYGSRNSSGMNTLLLWQQLQGQSINICIIFLTCVICQLNSQMRGTEQTAGSFGPAAAANKCVCGCLGSF